MGCAIASFAFMPPGNHHAQKLRGNRHHVFIPHDPSRVPPPQHRPAAGAPRPNNEAAEADCVSALHFVAPARPPPWRRRCVIFSHGNAEDLAHAFHYVAALREFLLCDTVAYDYCGYGLSPGECSEEAAYRCAETAFRYVTSPTGLGFAEDDVILIGRSLGSGPSTELAVRHRRVAALILLSPLTSCASVASSALGVVTTPFDLFRNEAKMPKVQCPVLVVHGTADEVIPFEHARSLVAAAAKRPVPADRVGIAPPEQPGATVLVRGKARVVPQPTPSTGPAWARLVTANNCGHNDIEVRLGRDFYRELRTFVSSLPTPTPLASAPALHTAAGPSAAETTAATPS